MSIGLAIIHLQAQTGGMDVELVLGRAATWDNEEPKEYDDYSPPPQQSIW